MKFRYAAVLALVPVLAILADIICVLVAVFVAVGIGEWLALKQPLVIYVLCPALGFGCVITSKGFGKELLHLETKTLAISIETLKLKMRRARREC